MVNLTQDEISVIEKKIHKFILNGKARGRISLTTLKKDKKDGGLRLCDLVAKQEALKIQNIFRTDPGLLDVAYQELGITKLGSLIWKCNLSEKDAKLAFGTGTYWVQTLQA